MSLSRYAFAYCTVSLTERKRTDETREFEKKDGRSDGMREKENNEDEGGKLIHDVSRLINLS